MIRKATKIPMKNDQTVNLGPFGFPGFGVVVLTPFVVVIGTGDDDPFLVDGFTVLLDVNVPFSPSYCSSIVKFPSDASVLLLFDVVSFERRFSVDSEELLSAANVV